MTLIVWRLVKRKYAATAMAGEGARLNGGRWNSAGVPVVYTSGSQSLAVLEVLVNLKTKGIPTDYMVIAVTLDPAFVEDTPAAKLPRGWKNLAAQQRTRQYGDQWVREGRTVALRVPSAVVDADANYLLNPAHPDFSLVVADKPKPFRFDPRLFTA